MNHHFVLVHSSCHGGWVWYKVKPLLEVAGHRVTALDLTASGIDLTKSITDVFTFEQYSEPLTKLLSSLPSDEKVVLVGHSFGGVNIAMAMDKFPGKIYGGIFVSAFMPDTKNPPSFVLEKFASVTPPEVWMDTEFAPYGPDNSGQSMKLGPEFLKARLYKDSPAENIALGLLVLRLGSMFVNDLSKQKNFSDKGYGSLPRAYIATKDDQVVPLEFQKWMISNFPVKFVVEIEGTDHMTMFCKPQLLCDNLQEIADKFV